MSIKIKNVESFIGQVVDVSRRDERIMSDVWDIVTYATVIKADGSYETLSGCYDYLKAEVDATPEQIQAYVAKVAADRLEAEAKAKAYAAEVEAMTVRYGKKVVVVRGRKVAKGTEGLVFWLGETKFGKKVGIALDDAKDACGRFTNVVWTALCNVEVVVS